MNHLLGISVWVIFLGPLVIGFKVARRQEEKKGAKKSAAGPLPAEPEVSSPFPRKIAPNIVAPIPGAAEETALATILAGKGPNGKKWKGTIFKAQL